jgi:iron complex outermembrane receptor protein
VQRTDRPVSWDVGAVYFILPALSVFGGASEGTYPIFNTEEPESIGQTPERTRQYEGGLRYALRSALTLSTALYETTRDDVFVVLTDAAGDEVPSTFSYQVKGWEVTLNANPTQRWSILANYAHQVALISSFPQTPADVGNSVPGVPSKLANLWTSYAVVPNAPLGTLQVAAGLRYRDLMYGDAGSTRIVPGYTLVDLMVSFANRRWSLRGGVNNVFDRQNFAYAAGTGGGAFPGPGTTFLLQASYTIH